MTKDEAIAKAETAWWRSASDREIVEFQLYEPLLCMPFSDFHGATERVLGRPVFSHEFARPEWLQAEFEGRREPLDPIDSLKALAPNAKVVEITVPEAK